MGDEIRNHVKYKFVVVSNISVSKYTDAGIHMRAFSVFLDPPV
jgi:hypothetical protein